MSNPAETEPLLPTSRSPRRAKDGDNASALKRTASMLQRLRLRRQSADAADGAEGASDGIDAVLCELENDEAESARFIFTALALFVAHIVSGALILSYLEGWPFGDSIYFCIVTTTTVGYGDITPKHPLSRLYVIFYVVGSIALFASFLSYLIGLLIDQQEEILLSAIVGENDSQSATEDILEPDGDEAAAVAGSTITSKILGATHLLELGDYVTLAFSSMWFIGVLITGIAIFIAVEGLTPLDAVYTTIISASTVGFGDYSPTSDFARVLICIWLMFSTTCVVKVVAAFTDASVKVKQRAVTRRLLTAQMDVASLRAMDRDGNKSVDKCEFVTELLVRSGKVDREEVDLMLKRFDQLDKTKTGEVTLEEVMAANGGE